MLAVMTTGTRSPGVPPETRKEYWRSAVAPAETSCCGVDAGATARARSPAYGDRVTAAPAPPWAQLVGPSTRVKSVHVVAVTGSGSGSLQAGAAAQTKQSHSGRRIEFPSSGIAWGHAQPSLS